MNARKTFVLFSMFSLVLVGSAAAAVNNVTADGHFVRMGTLRATAQRNYAGRSYAYRAPSVRSAPAIAAAQPQAVAQAPTEARRFSYEPSTAAASTVPCPEATASAPVVDGARRFSYEPTPEATAAPTTAPATQAYSPRANYSGRSGSRASIESWDLQKTDPRKYAAR